MPREIRPFTDVGATVSAITLHGRDGYLQGAYWYGDGSIELRHCQNDLILSPGDLSLFLGWSPGWPTAEEILEQLRATLVDDGWRPIAEHDGSNKDCEIETANGVKLCGHKKSEGWVVYRPMCTQYLTMEQMAQITRFRYLLKFHTAAEIDAAFTPAPEPQPVTQEQHAALAARVAKLEAGK